MAYRYNYRRRKFNPGQERARQHIRERALLEQKLGPIVPEVERMFFSLSPSDLVNLLDRYDSDYGKTAADYARVTYPRWQSGHRKMSGQTAARLLDLLPRYLQIEERFNLVELLAEHAPNRPTFVRLEIDVDSPALGLAKVESVFDNYEATPLLKRLPQDALDTITWISDHDVTAARQLLALVDQKRNSATMEYARVEMVRLRDALRSQKNATAQHTIELFDVRIVIRFVRRNALSRFLSSLFGGNS